MQIVGWIIDVSLGLPGLLLQGGLIIYDTCQYANRYKVIVLLCSCAPQTVCVPTLLSLKALRQWFKAILRQLAWSWLHESNMLSLRVFIYLFINSKTRVGLSLPSGNSSSFFFSISCRRRVAMTQNNQLKDGKKNVPFEFPNQNWSIHCHLVAILQYRKKILKLKQSNNDHFCVYNQQPRRLQ